jgi:hypothetical protein
VVSPEDRGVWAFTIGEDGALAAAGPRIPADGPGLAVSPDGRHLYDAGFFTNLLSTFDIDPVSGQLRQISGAGIDSGGTAPAFDAIGVLPDQGPVARFSTSHGRIDATSSVDRDGRIARYDWDFGDGARLADGGPRPAHRYARPGVYQVSLVVTDNEGCSTALVYTGRSALCAGSAAAHAVRTVVVT